MSLKLRTVTTQISNQENVKNVGKSATITVNSKRAALGELSNKVTVRTKDASGVFKLPAAKKLLEKGQSSSLEDDKKPVQKPVLKLVVSNSQKLEAEATASLSQIKLEKEPESFSSDLLPVEDIDQEDNDNPILVSVYTNEIYNYMRKLEQDFPVKENYLQGQQITYKMRSVLIDWLVEVHQQFRLLQETLYLTVAIIDRFLQSYRTIDRKRLQLVGVTAMFIASKYEELFSPDILDFVYITDNAYDKKEILQMELIIIKQLDYSFGRPLPLHFLRRYSKAGKALPLHHTMAKYFLEQSLVHYEMCHHPPSLVAAAALYLAFYVIGSDDIRSPGTVIWSQTLVHYSTYKKDDLVPIASAIATYVCNAEKSKYQAVKKKYASQKHMKVSIRSELRSPSFLALCQVEQKKVTA